MLWIGRADEGASLYLGLFVQLLLLAGWLLMDYKIMSSDRTDGEQIKRNVAISSIISPLMWCFAGALWGMDALSWWIIIPTFGVVIDDQVVGNAGVINALQKPLIQGSNPP